MEVEVVLVGAEAVIWVTACGVVSQFGEVGRESYGRQILWTWSLASLRFSWAAGSPVTGRRGSSSATERKLKVLNLILRI